MRCSIAISLGLRTVATGSIAGIEEPTWHARSELERLLPQRLRDQLRATEGVVVALPFSGTRTNVDVLTALASASRERRVVRFVYTSASGERTPTAHWYLVAWDRARDDWRTFRADRISDMLRPVPSPRGPCQAATSPNT